MGNYYEGSFHLRLKKDIPERLKTLLKGLQTKNWWADSSLSDGYKDIGNIDDTWKEFRFAFGSIYQDAFGEMNVDHVYENAYIEDMIEETGCVPSVSKYYIAVNICTKKYEKDSFDKFLAFIKPYMSDDNEYYLGSIEDEDGTYQQGYFFDKNKARLSLQERIGFCEGCELLKDLVPCGYEALCRRAYEKGKENADVN